MRKEQEMTDGCIKSRQRALRLINRVAKAIDDREAKTNEEIVALCTEFTTANCNFSTPSNLLLLGDFKGGFSSNIGSQLLARNRLFGSSVSAIRSISKM